MPAETDTRGIARGRVASLADNVVVLKIPHTDYQLHLVPSVDGGSFPAAVGQAVHGTIEAEALRIHAADGGGRFIEPVYGAPRIVAGVVREADERHRRVLVDVGVPMWVRTQLGQDYAILREGELVNFYVASGATFTPVDDAAGA